MSNISKLIWRRNETPEELYNLLDTLGEEYPIFDNGRGLKLEFRRVESAGIISRVTRFVGGLRIEYNSLSAAARGVGAASAHLETNETTPFKTLGIMLDVSRNMVMKVDHLKLWLRRLALCGYNLVMLYTENTYQLPGEPFFGYMRGAYSIDEIKELDQYAQKLGIELVGCIQTLGHLEQIIRWQGAYGNVNDTSSVLMVDEPATYDLIEKMISFWSSALDSRRIHIGMDEAHDLGRGKFLDHHGFEKPFELFNRHLGKVNEICCKYGLKPMIWSDMYFRLSNPEQEYYNLTSPIPDDVQKKIPKNVQLIYWDYYNENADFYTKMIQRHRDIGFEPVMGSGVWTWRRMWYDHKKTCSTVIPCIEACRKTEVKELFFTMWGDDGSYCNYDSALAGLVFSADLAFGVNSADLKTTAARFEAVCGSKFKANMTASCITAELSAGDQKYEVFPSILLWDDPLMGIYFDECTRRDPDFVEKITDYYDHILRKILPYSDDKSAGDFEYIITTLELLIKKTQMRNSLVNAYLNNDRMTLRRIAVSEIPSVVSAIQEFDALFRAQWLNCAKPFGLESIQIRNAGLIARLEETALRIREYLDGIIPAIEELDARIKKCDIVNNFTSYHQVSSGSVIR